ncbi:TadE/TadG family type IV pilus assembly protein [Hyphomonas sp. UBA4494]|jgi:Flp pilus assembly protein TadG|uniref:TadE/TadG family type IV pilus assembly protein n=1 Tax=Hyphomonas sp. UBA4494 TaxID=1946631 RepID=UPI0025BD3222|nr:TadE/TadG family type IV pilus assembly protein [Hyphomonas sp. UBA4494]
MRFRCKRFWGNDTGSSTIEFVVLMFVILATIFFVLESTLYLFFSAAIHKSAQAGARAAVVSTPLAAGVPATNAKTPAGIFGVACTDVSAPCVSFPPVSCTGTACDATQFNRIFAHMQGFSGQLAPDNVTITYEWTGLGFAGGPTVPLVTVTVSDVPFQTGVVGLLLTNAGVLATLPTHSVSMTGEDLNTGGAP